MQIKCVIIDGVSQDVEILKNYLKEFQNFELVAVFDSPLSALPLIESNEIDVIFLDINMSQMNGLEFLKSLTTRNHVVVTTAYRDYAVDCFDLDVSDYLIKPIPLSRFLKSINKLTNRISLESSNQFRQTINEDPFIFLKVDKKLVKIKYEDILYIESVKEYINVITINGNFLVHKSMTSISEELPTDNFLRIHRSFLVSKSKITAIEGNTVEVNKRRIPIGRNYLQFAKQQILHQ
ncbi:LytR/AlgR family response regulator transcription factor [Urechidicola croceus]|uniref:DNA-binding response regulator n=1 Tax=Urechidicola croceus TaxID=1850246 RepID=A0A1D8PA67_9FLAO|nr:LytTR family DNA-binding domain-containing protein [Urechidicola croceus]AOW21465.1 DNA-binding response regulator [Urechidicola croceus]